MLAAGILLGACNQTTTPPSMTGAPTSAPTAVASGATSVAPAAGQTDTDWGRIWDELPEPFPVFPGATVADETAPDPVSATLVLDGAEPRAVASWMQAELERAAYRTEALNGPFEDGRYILDLQGPADCRIEVAAGPLGGLTSVTIRYGAACPSP